MSEEKCESCGRAVPYDEIEYGWCPECIDEVTHDTDLILEYICDYRNNYGGNNYKRWENRALARLLQSIYILTLTMLLTVARTAHLTLLQQRSPL